ncbi:unnamed protein product [Ambrosiozyma monospora]|uniref:endopeptidase La n=1 Tax=Ambrosiozyma monospora TaxID=43982 RepID=A0A9W6SYE1_AMBMO|nr:unnamed protein product [Ambrosiozyma monospora]
MQASMSSDYQVLRTYLEVIMDLPWVNKQDYTHLNTINVDCKEAKRLLDRDHYGMESVKERILEYLAVLRLHERINKLNGAKSLKSGTGNKSDDQEFTFAQGDEKSSASIKKKEQPRELEQDTVLSKAPILLLTGPPGVGKTSLAKSIASTLGRKFQRISVGGLNDFADLKGNRRTYVGAIPGLIIQALRRSQSMNPVILLDEVDKIGSNSRKGDPEAALLEVLDPEQNTNFHDMYVGFPIDLSQVLFICTANDLWELSDPLRDRMEVIELSGYNYFEKIEICQKYVIPRQILRNGLPENSVIIDDDTVLKIAVNYTRESGIRNMERLVSSICRTKAIEYTEALDDLSSNEKERAIPENYNPVVLSSDLPKYIGIPPHLSEVDSFPTEPTKIQQPYGLVNGLSYNSDGSGSLLKFEMWLKF